MSSSDTSKEDDIYITCDICGRMVEISDLAIEENSDQRVCDMCRAEKESCGCSD